MTSLRITAAGDGARVTVRLQPRASRPGVGVVREGALELKVAAPPVEGKANAAARKLLASLLDIPPSRVRLASGGRSRNKVFLVEGMTPSGLRTRLEGFLKSP